MNTPSSIRTSFSLVFARGFLVALVCVLPCAWAAQRSSPLFDEFGHFAAGVALLEASDAGYYNVNPPLNRWVTAIALCFGPSLNLPSIPPSGLYANSTRPEFDLAEKLLALNEQVLFRRSLYLARLARIPLLLLAGYWLWRLSAGWSSTSRILLLLFWFTSPLLLGHGWVVSADGLSGIAMVFILRQTHELWHKPCWSSFAFSGLAWGLALGTKFTFGPLYLVYPVLVHVCVSRGWVSNMILPDRSEHHSVGFLRKASFMAPRWFLHALVACLTINSLYLFHQTGQRIGDHDFVGNSFSSLTKADRNDSIFMTSAKSIIGSVRSPFPLAYLKGVDQQMGGMSTPLGAYILGKRLNGAIHWFSLVGYFMKEQLAVWIALCFGGIHWGLGVCRGFRCQNNPSVASSWAGDADVSPIPLLRFCFWYLVYFCCFMATQSNLVWNIRYLMPALPLVYLLASSGFLRNRHGCAKFWSLPMQAFVTFLIACEFFANVPNHFSYINPLFGGSNRIPIALNDSNFDFGQDLSIVPNWLSMQKRLKPHEAWEVYGIFSGHGRAWLRDSIPPPSSEYLEQFLRRRPPISFIPVDKKRRVLIVSRGLYHPEPWLLRCSTLHDMAASKKLEDQVRMLLEQSPDAWITPVMVAYWMEIE